RSPDPPLARHAPTSESWMQAPPTSPNPRLAEHLEHRPADPSPSRGDRPPAHNHNPRLTDESPRTTTVNRPGNNTDSWKPARAGSCDPRLGEYWVDGGAGGPRLGTVWGVMGEELEVEMPGERPTLLVTLTGTDRPGLTSAVLATLATRGLE